MKKTSVGVQTQEQPRFSSLIQWLGFATEAVWLAVVFVIPFAFFPNIFTTFELAKVVFFEGATVVLFLLWILKYFLAGISPSFSWEKYWYLWLSLLAFCAFYVIATIFSVAPALSFLGWYPRFQGLFMVVQYLVFGAVIFFELKNPEQRERLFFVVIAGLLGVCAIAMFQKFLPGFLQWWDDSAFSGRIYGTLANPNYLASYIVMIVPLLIVNIFRKKRSVLLKPTSGLGLERILSWAALATGIAALLFTLSRAGFLAFFLSVLFLFVIVAVQRKAKKTLVFLGLLPFLAAGFVWFVLAHSQDAWIQNVPFLERLTTNDENISSAQERLDIWPAVLHQITVSPLFGFGPETFAVTFPSFAPASVNTREDQGEIPDHAHNELLDWAVEIGVPGMIAYLCFIFGLVSQGWKVKTEKIQDSKQHPEKQEGWMILGFSSSILGLFIANEFGFSVTVHFVYLTVFAAVMLNILHQKDFTTVEFVLNKFTKIGIFIVIAVLSLGFFWLHGAKMILADAQMRSAYDGVLALNSSGSATSDFDKNSLLSFITEHYRSAVKLAPAEAFYSLNSAYAQLQWLYEGEKVSSVQISEAINNAFHAARLRGYDSFSVSVGQELRNGF